MPPRSLSATGLRCCRQCRHPLPFRSFHESALRAADDDSRSNPSRREAARNAQYQQIDNLPRGIIRKTPVSSSASQFNRTATPQPMTSPSSGDNDQRTALPRDPARGGIRRGRGGPGGGAEGRLGGRGGADAFEGYQGGFSPGRGAGGFLRGRGRGDARGRARGRGRGRGRGDSRARGRGRGQAEFQGLQRDSAQAQKEWESVIRGGDTEADHLIETYGDAFYMPEEAHNYGQAVELINAWGALQQRRANFEQYKDSPATFGGTAPLTAQQIREMTDALDAREQEIDGLLAAAMRSLITTDQKFLPYHTPKEGPTSVTLEPGQPGGIPIGTQGTAAVLEEALRALAHRQTMEWRDPKALAQDLINGKFVKFRNYVEKSSVVRLAEEMQWQDGQRYRDEHVGFREPDPQAKKELVRRLVGGLYVDADDTQMQSAFLKNAARLAHFNSTYGKEDKEVLVRTLAEMMPQAQSQSQ